MRLRSVTLAAFILLVAGCGTVPGTGRRQLLLTSPSFENEQGAQLYQQVLQESEVVDDPELTRMVDRVGRRLASVVSGETPGDYDWRFTVLVGEDPNAFALPGGKVAIFTGILPFCRNEAGLAAVMGHEIAHAVARHGGERVSQGIVLAGTGVLLEVVLRENDVPVTERNLWLAAFGLGSQLGVLLPYSRTHELEADYLGMLYMARAGYDPREAIAFWNRFSGVGGQPPEWLSTHPHPETRSEELMQALERALQAYRDAPQQFGAGEPIPQPWREKPVPAAEPATASAP